MSTRKLQSYIALAKAQREMRKKYGIDVTVYDTLIAEAEKIVESEQKIEQIKASNPQIVLPSKKSWQDNVWKYILVSVVSAVIGAVIAYFIINYFSS